MRPRDEVDFGHHYDIRLLTDSHGVNAWGLMLPVERRVLSCESRTLVEGTEGNVWLDS
jgi:hypothetical protein